MKISNFEKKMLSWVSSHVLFLENKINKQKRSNGNVMVIYLYTAHIPVRFSAVYNSFSHS